MCGSYTVCGQLQRWILFIFFLSSSKIHLFDIDVPGKIRFQESETLSPGSSLSLFDTRERQPQTLAFCLAVWMSIHWSDVFLLQRSAKWVLGSAMTWGSRSSPSSTAGRVSVWKECLDFVFLWCTRADLCFCPQAVSCWFTPEPSTWPQAPPTGSSCRGGGQTEGHSQSLPKE